MKKGPVPKHETLFRLLVPDHGDRGQTTGAVDVP